MKKLPCTTVRRDLPFHLEGELDPMRSLEVASHLASCEGCREEAQGDGRILSSLRDLPEPEPGRDIAAGVLGALRAMRASLGPGAALKWSSLGLFLALLLMPVLRPEATLDLGVRMVSRLGELVNIEALLGGLAGAVPSLLASLTGLVESARDGLPAPGGPPHLISLILLPLLLLAAAFVLACLSGGLVLSAVRSPRLMALFRKSRATAPFDNPPGLP